MSQEIFLVFCEEIGYGDVPIWCGIRGSPCSGSYIEKCAAKCMSNFSFAILNLYYVEHILQSYFFSSFSFSYLSLSCFFSSFFTITLVCWNRSSNSLMLAVSKLFSLLTHLPKSWHHRIGTLCSAKRFWHISKCLILQIFVIILSLICT